MMVWSVQSMAMKGGLDCSRWNQSWWVTCPEIAVDILKDFGFFWRIF
jgi:hypothetical protein